MADFEQRAFDYTHRRKLYENYETYNLSRERGLSHFEDYELARQQLAYLRYEAIENLEANLLAFEENFTKNGGKVIWAENAQEACEAIAGILQARQASKILKAKSATTEEIGLKAFFEQQGLTIQETDLGDFIIQAVGEQASHFITPAQHLSRLQIGQKLQEKMPALFGENTSLQLNMFAELEDISAEEITEAVRKHLRKQYTEAEIGITGANFLVADVGGVAITENEGNARLLATFPQVHIAIAGIDKIIGRVADLALHWQMLGVNATGQRLTAYNTLYTGAKQPQEVDGVEEMYVILLDNGRTKMLADSRLRHALRCIKCGACANVCPVYRLVGGQAYQSPYSGAIGKVVNPHLFDNPQHQEMTYASTLCGACEEVCPVQIDLPQLILH
ncbi:MAG: lactate utilization protein, partial [Bacteroidetes bacterium]